MKYLQWARKDGEVVHISQVDRGVACQCICDQCGAPLIAKKGSILVHHFAHENSECQGNQETLLHLKAKEIIEESKRLVVKGSKGNEVVVFDRVEVEKQVGSYRVDALGFKNGRECIVEIKVTHSCSREKVQYFIDKKLAAVEITIDSRREFDSLDEYSEYVISGAARRWISNPVLKQESYSGVVPIDHERIREIKEKRALREPVFLDQLLRAAKPKGKLHYGVLVNGDLRQYGIPYRGFPCVKSSDLPNEYGNLAMVLWNHRELRKYLGRRVGFNIIYDYDQSLVRKCDILFPQVVIRWVKDVDGQDLSDEIGSRRWWSKDYSWL